MNSAMIFRAALTGLVFAAATLCTVAANRPPSDRDLVGSDGSHMTVLLVRVVTEVDGTIVEPFRHSGAADNVTFGLGGFETGMGVKEIGARFLSDETRKQGWVYMLVKPGVHYLAAREPMSTNAFTYSARWKTCPRWRVEIPEASRIHYAGTFFLPGRGRWMISGPRSMVEFDVSRTEVRDESVRAAQICRDLVPGLAPLTIQMAELLKPGDTMIIETPESKKDRPPVKP